MKNFIRFYFLFILITVFFSCSNDDNNSTIQPIPNGIITISGSVVLPFESVLDVNTLTVQSYTDFISVEDASYTIDVAEEKTNTLFVVDTLDEVVLMGYNYPTQTDFTINTASTVLAMVMNLSISQSLSQDGRIDFVNAIKSSTEFDNTVLLLDTILSQGLSPFDTSQEEFINAIVSLFNLAANNNREVQDDDDPVNVIRANSQIIFQNPGKSYSTYIGIYKEEQRLEYFELKRVNFVPTSISSAFTAIIDGVTGDINIEEIPYVLPSDLGNYEITIRTGKSFPDGTDEAYDAIKTNLTNVAMDVFFGVVKFKDDSNKECFRSVASNFKAFVEANANISAINSSQDLLNVSYDLLKNFIAFYTTSFNAGNLPYLCATNDATSFQKYLKSIEKKIPMLRAISIVGNLGNFGLGLYQWGTDYSELDYCYTVDENSVYDCEPNLDLSGDLNFGEVTINTAKDLTLTLTNSSDQDIVVSSIDLPEGFAADWTSGVLISGDVQEVVISFTPNDLIEFGGAITVNNDFNQDTNTIEASGIGVLAFILDGDLNFGDVSINSAETKTLIITNNMNQPLDVSLVELPTGYTANWSTGTINANDSQEVSILFVPNAVQSYNGFVTINNPIDQDNNTIPITGNGIPEVGEILLSGNLNFGSVTTNTNATTTLSISNESTFAVNVSSLSLPNGFTADWNGGQIDGGFVTDVIITFSPTVVQDYSGTIVVNNDTDQVNNTIAVIGNGTDVGSNMDERLFAYANDVGEIVELDLNTGAQIGQITTLSSYLFNYVYFEQTNELFAVDGSSSFRINIEDGSISDLNSNSYSSFAVSNTTNKLYATIFTDGEQGLYEINISSGEETLIDENAYGDIMVLESSNEIILNRSSDGVFKYNLNTGQLTQFTDVYYQFMAISKNENRIFANTSNFDKIVEIDPTTGAEIGIIYDFTTTASGSGNIQEFIESNNDLIIFTNFGDDVYKLNIFNSILTPFGNSYEYYISTK